MPGVQYLQSDLLASAGVRHGWFMRNGGVSKGSFESLNGKKGIGDRDENVAENRNRALGALFPGTEPGNRLVHILHEFKIGILTAKKTGEFDGYDAIISIDPNLVLSQTTADCGSVVIASSDGKAVALAHGSWRTLKDKIICDVVAKLKQHTKSGLVAGVGPMICQNCYEFGAEAPSLFDKKYLKKAVRNPKLDPGSNQRAKKIPDRARNDKNSEQKYLVDLKRMIIDQLKESGVTKIDDLNVCTKEDQRFFSHRRSGAHSGRFLTLVSPRLTDVV